MSEIPKIALFIKIMYNLNIVKNGEKHGKE